MRRFKGQTVNRIAIDSVDFQFNWIIEKTNIQNASKVRSTNGLLLHCFGKLAMAAIKWVF